MSQPIQSQPIQSLLGLHHREALEFAKTIPNDSIDLIITDPPYDFAHMHSGGNLVAKKSYWKNIASKAENLAFGFDFALLAPKFCSQQIIILFDYNTSQNTKG